MSSNRSTGRRSVIVMAAVVLMPGRGTRG
jgi:hypothetical protein